MTSWRWGWSTRPSYAQAATGAHPRCVQQTHYCNQCAAPDVKVSAPRPLTCRAAPSRPCAPGPGPPAAPGCAPSRAAPPPPSRAAQPPCKWQQGVAVLRVSTMLGCLCLGWTACSAACMLQRTVTCHACRMMACVLRAHTPGKGLLLAAPRILRLLAVHLPLAAEALARDAQRLLVALLLLGQLRAQALCVFGFSAARQSAYSSE